MTPPANHNELLEPLKIALKLEVEGRQFFFEAAQSSQSKFARQTFEFLAKEEEKHIENINRFSQSIIDSDGRDYLDVGISDAAQKLTSFNERLAKLKDEFEPSMSDVQAYQFALDFENGAEEFYAEKMAEAKNPMVKKFYQWLIDEESMHSRVLTSCMRFAEDPQSWFKSHK